LIDIDDQNLSKLITGVSFNYMPQPCKHCKSSTTFHVESKNRSRLSKEKLVILMELHESNSKYLN